MEAKARLFARDDKLVFRAIESTAESRQTARRLVAGAVYHIDCVRQQVCDGVERFDGAAGAAG